MSVGAMRQKGCGVPFQRDVLDTLDLEHANLFRVTGTPPSDVRTVSTGHATVRHERATRQNEAGMFRRLAEPRRARSGGGPSVGNDDAMHLPGNSLSGYGLDDDLRSFTAR